MTVREIIAALANQDPGREVRIALWDGPEHLRPEYNANQYLNSVGCVLSPPEGDPNLPVIITRYL